MPKTEDHFIGHRFEIEPNGFLGDRKISGACTELSFRQNTDDGQIM